MKTAIIVNSALESAAGAPFARTGQSVADIRVRLRVLLNVDRREIFGI